MITRTQFFTFLFLTILSFGLCACETMDGAGRDIEHAGEAVQKSAN
jgi:predicted small secreted protein